MIGTELMHFLKFVIGIENPKTQTTLAEQQAIKKYSTDLNFVVEIGVFEGYNTLNIAKSIGHKGKLYAIDPFIKGRIGICYGELISDRYIKRADLHSKVKFIKKYSYEAHAEVPDKVEFIFIDGDHTYEGIKSDWEIWSEKIGTSGVIALHDTSETVYNPTVKELGSFKFYNEFIEKDPRFIKLETVDSMNILRRVR